MKKYKNFCASLNNLRDIFSFDEPYSNVVLTGLVALYAICFEQSWKAMKEILESNGIEESCTGSPKQIIKSAYQVGMINDENLWLEALISRNNVAHSYNKEIALAIVRDTKDKYYKMFCDLQQEMERFML